MSTPLVKYWVYRGILHTVPTNSTEAVYLAADVETVVAGIAQAEALLKLSFDALHHGGYVSPLQLAILKLIAPLGVMTARDIAAAQCPLAQLEETP